MINDNVARFERLLTHLERELLEATDAEVLAAAADLGMSPMMKGSAAFFGVTTRLGPPVWPGDPWQPADKPGARRGPKA